MRRKHYGALYTKNTKNITLRYLLIVVVIKYSLLKSKMAETGSGSGPKAAVYTYYRVTVRIVQL